LQEGTKDSPNFNGRLKGFLQGFFSSELKDQEITGFIEKKVSVGYPVLIEYELASYSHTKGCRCSGRVGAPTSAVQPRLLYQTFLTRSKSLAKQYIRYF